MKNLLFLLVMMILANVAGAQLNLSLYSQFDREDIRYSGSWIFTDPDSGHEYALLGARTGLAAYSMDDPDIAELGFVPGPGSNWREVTVVGQYAYVVTEGNGPGEGMQVIDLSYLPDSLHLVTTYTATFSNGHIIQRDVYSDAPYVYVNGTCSDCGINIIDVSDPTNPVEVGYYNPGYYIHDCMVKGDRIYAAAIYEARIDVIDISDKTAPSLIATIPDPGFATHSSWVTEDDRYLAICDESTGLPMNILNIEDLDNPFPVASYIAHEESIAHNPYIRGDFLFLAHNALGLRVLDIADPTHPVEVGYYDTWPGENMGSHGLWSACPFSPSGKIIGGNREDGIYVWEFNNTYAGRLYGVVKDSLTGEVLTTAAVWLNPVDSLLDMDIVNGEFCYGSLAQNDLQLDASHTGYNPKSFAFDLLEGDSLWFEIELTPDWWVPVSVKETTTVPTLKVNPNPARETIMVDLSEFPRSRQLALYDLFGQAVLAKAISGSNIELTIEGLAESVYQLQVYDRVGELLGSSRIVVSR